MYTDNFKYMIGNSNCCDVVDYLIKAEKFVYKEPIIATYSLLSFIEIVVKRIYRTLNQHVLSSNNFDYMLKSKDFFDVINVNIVNKFYKIDELSKYLIEYDEDLDDDTKVNLTLELLENIHVVSYWYSNSLGLCECQFKKFINPIYHATIDEPIEDIILDYEGNKSYVGYKVLDTISFSYSFFSWQNNLVASEMGFEKNSIDLISSFKNYELTDSQNYAINKLDKFLIVKEQKIFILKGYGGSGKTFITKGLTDYLDLSKVNYILTAPTGKAAKVIQNKTNKIATTIHKMIYCFKDIYDDCCNKDDVDTYKMYFNIDENNVQPSNTVFIIDESSMIGDNYQKNEFFSFGSSRLLTDLIKFTNILDDKFNNKILFIGDTAQLPPVGMKDSPALDMDYLVEKYNLNIDSCELTDVVRQKKESGILINSLILRKKIQYGSWQQGVSFDLNYDEIMLLKDEELIINYLKACDGKITDNTIIIAYKNEMVEYYNKLVREYFFPNKHYITQGDKIMVVENYRDSDKSIFNGDYGYIKKVNEQIIQREISVKTKINDEKIFTIIPLQFRKVEIEFIGVNKSFTTEILIFENILYRDKIYTNTGFELDIKKYVLSDNDISKIERLGIYLDVVKRAEQLGIKSNKKEFKKFITEDPYFNSLKVKFGYSITCHKSQGSEWENVFINCNFHNKLSVDYLRWLYTAITRSSKNLYLINLPA